MKRENVSSADLEFLAEAGIAPVSIRRLPSRVTYRSVAAEKTYAHRLFSRPEFSQFFDIVKGRAWERRAVLRARNAANLVGNFGLFNGCEIDVMLSTCWPHDGDLILFISNGEPQVAPFRLAADERLGLWRLPMPNIDNRMVEGFAIIDAVGPNEVPEFAIGETVIVCHGIRSRRPDSALVERKTSRAYHLRFTGRGLHRLTFREIRDGQYRLTRPIEKMSEERRDA